MQEAIPESLKFAVSVSVALEHLDLVVTVHIFPAQNMIEIPYCLNRHGFIWSVIMILQINCKKSDTKLLDCF